MLNFSPFPQKIPKHTDEKLHAHLYHKQYGRYLIVKLSFPLLLPTAIYWENSPNTTYSFTALSSRALAGASYWSLWFYRLTLFLFEENTTFIKYWREIAFHVLQLLEEKELFASSGSYYLNSRTDFFFLAFVDCCWNSHLLINSII